MRPLFLDESGRGDLCRSARADWCAVEKLPHGAGASLPMVASPMRFSETPLEYRSAPPLLGQHTEEVLRGLLGTSESDIAKLRSAKVI